jgi:MFS family permease
MERSRSAFDRVFRPGGDGRIFYGWKIVAAGSVTQLLVSGLFLQAYGAYVVLLHRDLGWSVTMLSAGYSLARTESAVLGPIQGHMLDRLGPRMVMRVGVMSLGVGFLILSAMHVPWQFFTAMVLLAIGSSFCGFVSVSAAVVNWFRRSRATALGAASIGFALGGLLVPLTAAALTAFGWRAIALASGIGILLVGPPLVQVVRHRPSELGLHADGMPSADIPHVRAAQDAAEPEAAAETTAPGDFDFTARQALRTPAFWQLSLGHGLAVVLVSALMVHLIPHLTTSLGYSLQAAGFVVAVLTLIQILGMVLGGMIGDRFDKRAIAMTAMVMHGSAVLVLTIAVTPVLIGCFALLHGLAWGARGPLMQAWRADLFGNTSFATILGYSSLIVMLGSASGPLLAGALFDHLGSYTTSLRVLAGFATASLVMFSLVWPPTRPAEPR